MIRATRPSPENCGAVGREHRLRADTYPVYSIYWFQRRHRACIASRKRSGKRPEGQWLPGESDIVQLGGRRSRWPPHLPRFRYCVSEMNHDSCLTVIFRSSTRSIDGRDSIRQAFGAMSVALADPFRSDSCLLTVSPRAEGQGSCPHFATLGPRSRSVDTFEDALTPINSDDCSPVFIVTHSRMQVFEQAIREEGSRGDGWRVAGRKHH